MRELPHLSEVVILVIFPLLRTLPPLRVTDFDDPVLYLVVVVVLPSRFLL